MSLSATSLYFLNTPKDGNPTTSVGNLSQYLTTLSQQASLQTLP